MCAHHTHRYRVMAEDPSFTRRRHGGWGGFGGPWGGPGGPWGGGPRGRGRRRRGDVRIALLLLLAEEPRNGYQLMQTLEERSEGSWRPSPGSVYPALSQLEDEGFVRSVQSDSGRTFEITDAGREHLAERGDERAPWEPAEDEVDRDTYRSFGKAIASTAKAAAQVAQEGDEAQLARAIELLAETRRALYRLLAGDADGDE
jgi:DNA-binding PadR family transcriptional regulator